MDKIVKKLFQISEINDPVIRITDKLYNKRLQNLLDRTDNVLFKKAILIADHLMYWVEIYLDNDKELYRLSQPFRNEKGEYYSDFIGSIVNKLIKHRQDTHYGAYNVMG